MARLIGREAELAKIDELIADGWRGVVIVGLPGVGKSALVRAWLARAGRASQRLRAPDGDDPDALAFAVGRATGLDDNAPSWSRIAAALAGRGECVLFIDDLGDGPACLDALDALLDGCPELSLLATSRRRPRLADVATHHLGGLPTPDEGESTWTSACDLWQRRACERDAAYRVPAGELARLGRVLRRLGGNPLAIELLVAALPTTSLRRLDEQLDELIVGAEAEGGLRAALETSIAHAGPKAIDHLSALVALTAPVDGELAAALLDDPSGRVLRELSRHALIETEHDEDGEPRHRIAPVVRVFVARRVDVAVVEAARRRAFDVLVERATQLDGETRRERPRQLPDRLARDVEHAVELLADLQRWEIGRACCLAELFYWGLHFGVAGAVAPTLEALACAAKGGANVDLARAKLALAKLRHLAGDPRAVSDFAQTRALAEGPAPTLALRALVDQAWGAVGRGDSDAVRELAAAEIALGERIGDASAVEIAHCQLGIAASHRGETDEAIRALREALLLNTARGHPQQRVIVLANLGMALSDAGLASDARQTLREASATARQVRNPVVAAMAQAGLGVVRLSEGDRDGLEELGEGVRKVAATGRATYASAFRAYLVMGRLAFDDLEPSAGVRALHDAIAPLPASDIHRAFFQAVAAGIDALRGLTGPATRALDAARSVLGDKSAFTPVLDTVAGLLEDDAFQRQIEGRLSTDARFALMLFERLQAAGEPARGPSLRIAEDYSWFETAAGRIDLRRRRVMRELLRALVDTGERPIDRDDLVAAVWRGERMRVESGRNRLHASISRLRLEGLEEMIETVGNGYRLGRAVDVQRMSP